MKRTPSRGERAIPQPLPKNTWSILGAFALTACGSETAQPSAQDSWIPPGWYAGDTHEHVQLCDGLEDRPVGDMLREMDELGLSVVSSLVWNPYGAGYAEHVDLITGAEHALTVSRPDRFLQFGIETSGLDCDDLGHLVILRPDREDAELLGPFRSCQENDGSGDYSTPILDAVGRNPRAVFGYAHQMWNVDRYHPKGFNWSRLRDGGYAQDVLCTPLDAHLGFPPLSPLNTEAFPTLCATEVVLGKVDYLETVDMTQDFRAFDPQKETRWWGMYYRLQNAGVRVGIGAGTDTNCFVPERDARCWIRVEGELSYDAWVDGLVAGRASLSAGMDAFLDLSVGEARIGDELTLEEAGRVKLVTTLHLAGGKSSGAGAIEILVNGEPVERLALDQGQRGEKQSFELDLTLSESAWIAARTDDNTCHTAAVYAIVQGQPIGQCEDAEFWTLWCDRVTKGVRDFDFPETFVGCSGPAILEALAEGRRVFAAYRDFAHGLPPGARRLGHSTAAQDGPIAIVAPREPSAEGPLELRCIHAPARARGTLLYGRALLENAVQEHGADVFLDPSQARRRDVNTSEGGYVGTELPADLGTGTWYFQYVWPGEGSDQGSASDVLALELP